MIRVFQAAALAVLVAGCATTEPISGAAARDVVVGETASGSTIAVAGGGTVTVELNSAAGTPYEWVVVETPSFLRLASSEKVAAAQPAGAPPIVGGPVTNRFVFQATGTGNGQLRLALRSFVGGREDARTWAGTVIVR